MPRWSDTKTSVSLLEVLRDDPVNEEAWDVFVRRYRPKIYGWCREWGLQGADADDVAQTVLAKLTEAMRNFRYDPSRCFRAWLKTITQHAWSDLAAGRRGDDRRAALLSRGLEGRADLRSRGPLEDSFDLELLDLAMLQVRGRVAEPTWEAFRLTALEGLSGTEASRRLNMPVASVFVSKHRVQKMLREEVHRLGGDEDGPSTE